MPCLVLPLQMQEPAAVAYQESLGAAEQRTQIAGTSASGRANLQDLHVGTTRYPLYTALPLELGWDGAQWVCWSPSLGSACSGRATSPLGAREEWGRQVHALYQRLYSKRPIHMTPDEAASWARLGTVVNVGAYREMTPLALREIGQVRYEGYPYPHAIEWIHGGKDTIRVENAPPELAGYKTGQWIEACVLSEPRTGRLLQIEHVQRIKSPPPVRDATLQQQWEGLPVAKLPESEWDELTS